MPSSALWKRTANLFSSRAAMILLFAQLLWHPSLLTAQATTTVVSNLGDVVSRPMPGSGHDYIKGLVETVNPANGQLSIKIDLPVPADRGLTLPYAITYNSGELYNVDSSRVGCGGLGGASCDGTPGGPGSTNRSWMGWSDTFPYVTYSMALALLPPYNANCWISGSYNFYDPTGGSHMLGLAGISGVQGGSGDGAQFENSSACTGATYNNINCFNQQEDGAGAEGCQGGPVYQAYSIGGDDEVLALSDYCTGNYQAGNPNNIPADCSNGTPAFTVTDSNGTTYFFPQGMTPQVSPLVCGGQVTVFPYQIEDRNGNILQDNSVTSGSSTVLQITDTSGRVLFSPWCPYTGSTGTTPSSGFNVGSLYFGTTWTTTQPNFSESSGTDYFQIDPPPSSYNISCTASFSIAANPMPVLQSLVLPNGQQYQFKYDPTYGLVNEIDYPDGGWVKYTWGLADEPSELGSFAGLFTQNSSIPPVVGACNYIYKAPVVKTRTVGYSQGSAPALTQNFGLYNTSWPPSGSQSPNAQCITWDNDNVCWSSKQTTVSTTDNLINKTSTTTYNYTNVFQPPQPNSIGQAPAELPVEQQVTYTDWGSGPVIETVNKQWADQFEMTLEQTVWNATSQSSHVNYSYNSSSTWQNPFALQSYSAYAFNFPGQMSQKMEYDYNQASASRITNYSYYTFEVPSGAPIVRPNMVKVTDGTGTWSGESDAEYDNQGVLAPSYNGGEALSTAMNLAQSTYDGTNYGTNSKYGRGNPTKVVRCTSSSITSSSGTTTPCTGPTTTYTFDETGQEMSMKDPLGNTTAYSYADHYTKLSGGQNASYSPSANTNALLTQITDALGFSQNFTYDYNSTYLTGAADENRQPTSYVYNDSLNRPTSINYPDGGQTEFVYNDALPNPTVTTCTLMSGTQGVACSPTSPTTGWKTSVAVRDGLDHVIETELVSDPEGTDYQSFAFDGEGHTYQAYNPYRSTSDPTYGITTSYFDAVGRPTEVLHPDFTTELWSYSGNVTTFTDEDTNQWMRTTDALGRLTQVQEPSRTSTAASMVTNYQYDPLNNLLKVTQNGVSGVDTSRVRTFNYDGLSRLLCVSNPENSTVACPTIGGAYVAGTVGYAYDANGNVISKTDARGVTVNYTYNALNQILGKTYSNDPSSTPSSCYQYGTSTTGNTVERLINEWTQSASAGACPSSLPATYLSLRGNINYDPMGRALNEQQATPLSIAKSTSYPMIYTYDCAGNQTASIAGAVPPAMTLVAPAAPTSCVTAPSLSASMLTFEYLYDGAGSLQKGTSNTNSGPTNLFVAQGYAPFGALTSAIYGNNAVTVTRGFNKRLRIISENDTGNPGSSTSGSATVTIVGIEQSQ